MKFRSWYIVLLGILLQSGLALLFLASTGNADAWGGVVATTLGLILLITAIGLGALPLLLLLFSKTRKIGAIVSIVLGVIGIVIQAGMFIGVFLVTAGVISLWRKI